MSCLEVILWVRVAWTSLRYNISNQYRKRAFTPRKVIIRSSFRIWVQDLESQPLTCTCAQRHRLARKQKFRRGESTLNVDNQACEHNIRTASTRTAKLIWKAGKTLTYPKTARSAYRSSRMNTTWPRTTYPNHPHVEVVHRRLGRKGDKSC